MARAADDEVDGRAARPTAAGRPRRPRSAASPAGPAPRPPASARRPRPPCRRRSRGRARVGRVSITWATAGSGSASRSVAGSSEKTSQSGASSAISTTTAPSSTRSAVVRSRPPVQVGQHQRDEEQRPEVGEPARGRDRKQRVVLAEQSGEEEGEPGGRHEQAAAAVRATPPRDQPARGEGTADQAQDDVDRIRRAVAEHHRRQHGQLGHRGDGPQREPDTAHVDHRGEPVDQPGAASAPRPRNRVARHRPAVRHEGRRPAVGPAADRL